MKQSNHNLSRLALILVLTSVWSVLGHSEPGPGSEAQAKDPIRGGTQSMPKLTPDQQAAIQAFNEANAPLTRAVNEARSALNAAIYTDKPETADITAKAETLAAAELRLAQTRAEGFAKIQASPNKLNLPAQQIIMLLGASGRTLGSSGGFGGGPGLAFAKAKGCPPLSAFGNRPTSPRRRATR